MARPILVGIGAAFLSWVLLVVCTVCWLSWTRSGHFARDQRTVKEGYTQVQKQYGEPFELLSQGAKAYDFLILPLISIVTGVVVGAASRKQSGWTAIVALLPLQILVVVADDFRVWGLVRALVYLSLAYLSAVMMYRTKGRTTSHA
jgi:hypothetical protein